VHPATLHRRCPDDGDGADEVGVGRVDWGSSARSGDAAVDEEIQGPGGLVQNLLRWRMSQQRSEYAGYGDHSMLREWKYNPNASRCVQLKCT